MAAPSRNFTKPFSIAGFVVAELYMLFTVLAPNLSRAEVPIGAQIMRVMAASLFFGPFGALVGMGIGLLVTGLWQKLKR